MKDEDFYGEAAREIATRQHSEALMAKAYALALGDPEKTKALYIGMRADQLKEEVARRVAESIAQSELEQKRRLQKEIEERRVAAVEEKKRREEERAIRRRQEAEDAERGAVSWNSRESTHDGWQISREGAKPEPPSKATPNIPRRVPVPPVDLDNAIKVMREALEEANRKMNK